MTKSITWPARQISSLWLTLLTFSGMGCVADPPSAAPTGLVVVTPEIEVQSPPQELPSAIKATIQLKNFGPGPITIQTMTTTCSCVTVVSEPGFAIPPNDACDIVLQVTPPAHGEKDVQLVISTTANATPLIATIKARGQPIKFPIVSHPVENITVTRPPGDVFSMRFTLVMLETPSELPCVTGFNASSDRIVIELEGPPEEKPLNPMACARVYNAVLKGSMADFAGGTQISVSACLKTDTSIKGTTFQVNIHPKESVRAIPEVVNLGRNSLPTQRIVLLESDDQSDWELQENPKLPSWITLTNSEKEVTTNGHRQRLTLTFQPPQNPAETQATIIFLTTHPNRPQITIPVYFASE